MFIACEIVAASARLAASAMSTEELVESFAFM